MSRKFLEIRNLTKTYFQKNKPVKEALRGVSLDLFEGEIFALLGVNGAGKTTLSSILASLHPPSTGEVLWKGSSIYEDIISYRQIIGFCPQKPNIDRTFNLRDNLIFSGLCYGMDPKKTETRVDDLIERFDLKGYVDADLKFLSGGYKQRFLLARALVHFPKLIILDEPTVGLDPHVRRHLWESIHSVTESGKDKESLLLAWKNKHDPLGGTSNEGEPLNALSHAEEATLAKDLGVEIFWDWDAPRTFEGYYQIKGGVAMSIARGRAFAPYADMLWMETASPNIDEAALFAQGISRLYPKKFLAYNLSPSFNWDKFGMTDPEIASYQDKLGNLGYVWQFITLAGFHGDALFAKTFAKDFAERKMLAYVQGVQRKEREQKVSALTHQKWSGVELIGSQQNAATDNRNSTGAHGSKSTEHQFSKNTAHK